MIQNPLSRRQFLTHSSLAGLTTLSGPSLAQASQHKGFVDAHVHVWTPDTESYPLSAAFNKADMQPASFTPEQLWRSASSHGVNRVVLIQMSFYGTDNRYMLDAIAADPERFRGVAIIDHQANDAEEQMTTLKSQGVTGFRLYADAEKTRSWLADTAMASLWDSAALNGQAVCLLANPDALPFIDQLCERHPDTTVVIDHFARIGMKGPIDPEQVNALLKLARHAKVHVKTSAFYALGAKKPPYKDLLPLIKTLRDSFGAQRLMWATDCPYQLEGEHRYEGSLHLISEHADFLNEQEKEALLRETASKVFFS